MPVAKSWSASSPRPSPLVSSEAPRVRLPFLIPRPRGFGTRRAAVRTCGARSLASLIMDRPSIMIRLFIVVSPDVNHPTPSLRPPAPVSDRAPIALFDPRDPRTPRGPARTAGRWRPRGITASDPRATRRDTPRRPMRGGAVYSGAESAKDRRASHPNPSRSVGRAPPSRRCPGQTPAGRLDRPAREPRRRTGPPSLDR